MASEWLCFVDCSDGWLIRFLPGENYGECLSESANFRGVVIVKARRPLLKHSFTDSDGMTSSMCGKFHAGLPVTSTGNPGQLHNDSGFSLATALPSYPDSHFTCSIDCISSPRKHPPSSGAPFNPIPSPHSSGRVSSASFPV